MTSELLAQAEMPTIHIFAESPIFKADFCITISNIKITANNDFKMVPDKITWVTPNLWLYLITGSKIKQTGLCVIYWKTGYFSG